MAEEGQGTEGQDSDSTGDMDSLWDAVNADLQIAATEGLPEEAFITDRSFADMTSINKGSLGWLEATAKDERATRAWKDPKAEYRNRRVAYLRGWQKRQEKEELRQQERIQRARAFPRAPQDVEYAKGPQPYQRPRSGFWWHFMRGLLMKDPW